MINVLLFAGLAALVIWQGSRYRRRRAKRDEASQIALELEPEICSLIESSDPANDSDGEPAVASYYPRERERLARVFPKEPLFAVETFYQCIEAYRRARLDLLQTMRRDDAASVSLGDKVRAKDLRDRSLKDVYYTGEAALQAVRTLCGPPAHR